MPCPCTRGDCRIIVQRSAQELLHIFVQIWPKYKNKKILRIKSRRQFGFGPWSQTTFTFWIIFPLTFAVSTLETHTRLSVIIPYHEFEQDMSESVKPGSKHIHQKMCLTNLSQKYQSHLFPTQQIHALWMPLIWIQSSLRHWQVRRVCSRITKPSSSSCN